MFTHNCIYVCTHAQVAPTTCYFGEFPLFFAACTSQPTLVEYLVRPLFSSCVCVFDFLLCLFFVVMVVVVVNVVVVA